MSKEKIREFIQTEFNTADRVGDLADDYPLLEKELIDSMGVLKIVGFLESALGVEVDDLDLVPGNFASIDAIAEYVASQQRV